MCHRKIKEIMTEGMACTFSNPVTFARVYVPAVRKEAYTNMSDANHGKEEEAIKPKFDIGQDFNAYLQKAADVYEAPTSSLKDKVTASEVLEEKCRSCENGRSITASAKDLYSTEYRRVDELSYRAVRSQSKSHQILQILSL